MLGKDFVTGVGYSIALLYKNGYDGAEILMRESGLTLKDFQNSSLDRDDYEEIKRMVKG